MTSSWSPYGAALDSGRSGETVLLGVGSCLISFVGNFANLFDLGVVI